MGRGATFWPVCRVTVLGSAYCCVFKVRQSARAKPFEGASREAQFPAGVVRTHTGHTVDRGKHGPVLLRTRWCPSNARQLASLR